MTAPQSLDAGSKAPDFSGVDTDGAQVRLSGLWRQKPLVVVFLRHLGCTFCRRHVLQLKQQYAEFRALGAEVVCVAMGDAKLGRAFRILFDLPFPVLMTGELENAGIYREYGLSRGSFLQLFGLNSIRKGFAALADLKGLALGRLVGDGAQMPGTFIIDRSGTIRLAYRSKDAADNPPNHLLLETLRAIAGEEDAGLQNKPQGEQAISEDEPKSSPISSNAVASR